MPIKRSPYTSGDAIADAAIAQLLGCVNDSLDRRLLAEHRFDILFGVGCILYVLAMAAVTVICYRVFIQGWLTAWIPLWVASGLAWVMAGAVAMLSITSVLGDMLHPAASRSTTRMKGQ